MQQTATKTEHQELLQVIAPAIHETRQNFQQIQKALHDIQQNLSQLAEVVGKLAEAVGKLPTEERVRLIVEEEMKKGM